MTSRLESIADPTRLAVTRYLAAHPSCSAPQVASGTGVHLNTARAHLTALEKAGLTKREAERGRVGRPIVRFRLIEDWQPRGDELLALSSLLAAALAEVDADPGTLRAAAVRWGRQWTSGGSFERIEERLVGALRRLGFRAEAHDGRLELAECPCPTAAPGKPPLVCALVDAVIDGVLEGSGLSAGARHHDPVARRCSAALSIAPT
jgi:predicted ArsR family transcriptional regulator